MRVSLIAIVVLSACVFTANAFDESVPVRPGGVDGRLFWNGHSARFIFAPAFGFKEVEGAIIYRFTVVDDELQVRSFEAERPTAALSPVWKDLPVGYVRVMVDGVDAKGRVVGESGTRRFWRDAPYKPGGYKDKPWPYMECVRRYYPVLFAHTNTQHFLAMGTPDGITDLFNIYPSKMNSALIRGMIRYSKLDPARRDDAMKVAKAAGGNLCRVRHLNSRNPNLTQKMCYPMWLFFYGT